MWRRNEKKNYSSMMMILLVIVIVVAMINLICSNVFYFYLFKESLTNFKSLNNVQDLFYKLVSFTISSARSTLEILLLILITIINYFFYYFWWVLPSQIHPNRITIYHSWLFIQPESVQSLDLARRNNSGESTSFLFILLCRLHR